MIIGLMGCEFTSPNKGCEALTYSIISILNDLIKNKKITIINFSGTEIGYFSKEFPNIEFINVYPNIKDLSFKYIKALKSCDVIFDATMGDSFSDIYSKKYYNWLIMNKKLAEFFCKNYILLPQTYGPFNTKKSLKKAIKVIKKATKVYSRDDLSRELIVSNGIKNVELMTDMAFMLPYKKTSYSLNNSKKIKIGINISGLLYKGGFNSNNQFGLTIDYKKLIDLIIKKYSNDSKYEVHIIPHVIDLSNSNKDDDYRICEYYVKKYKNCILSPAFMTPVEAKSYISNMDIFIGSRMHSTIAAFSTDVVTIPISYSRKFEGLFNSVKYNYLINGKEVTTKNAIEKINYYINNVELLKENQKKSLDIINDKIDTFVDNIKVTIDSIKQ